MMTSKPNAVHQRDGVARRAGEAAKVAATRHRSDEDVFIGVVFRRGGSGRPGSRRVRTAELGSTENDANALAARPRDADESAA